MPRLLLFAAILGVAVIIYALIDCVMSRKHDVRGISKTAWFVTILVLPLIGAGMWFLLGRPRNQEGPSGPRRPAPRKPSAPDDDPAFLQNLETQRRQQARERERRIRDQAEKDRQADAGRAEQDKPSDGGKTAGEDNDDAGSGSTGAHRP